MPLFAFKVSPKQTAESQLDQTRAARIERRSETNSNSPVQIELALANCSYVGSGIVWVQEFGSPRPAPDSMLDAAKLSFLAMVISTLEDEREPGLVAPELFDKFWSIELLDGELLLAEENRSQIKTPVVDALARDSGFASRTLRKLAKAPTRSPKRLSRFSVKTSDSQLEELKSRLPEGCVVLREQSPRLGFHEEIDYYLEN